MIARGVYRPMILLGGITTRINVRFSSDRAGKDANTQQSIKTIPKQQIGKKNMNDRVIEVDHTEKLTKSSLTSPQTKEVLSQEQFEKVTTEKTGKRQKQFGFKMQSEEKDKKIEIKVQHQEKSNKIPMGQLIIVALTFGSLFYFHQRTQQEAKKRHQKTQQEVKRRHQQSQQEAKKRHQELKKLQQDSHKIQKQKREQQIKKSPQTIRKERIKLFTEENLNITEFENQVHNKNQQNSTRKQLKHIVDEEHIDRLSLLQVVTGTNMSNSGLPGNGKSTQLKKIVKELRKEGHIVYYLNLRNDKMGGQTSMQAFLEAEQVVSYFLDTNLDPTKNQKVFLFIDDINMLQPLQEDQTMKWRLGNLWINLATVGLHKNFKAVVISSSSSYMGKLESKSYVVKGSKFHTIKNKTTEQMSQSVQNMLDFYLKENSGQYQSVKRHLIDERYTLRNAIEIVKSIRPSVTTEKEFLKDLQTQENEKIKKSKIQIYQKLKKNFKSRTAAEKQYDRSVLAEIIKMKQFNGTNGCLNIVQTFLPLDINDLVIQNTQGLHNYLEQEDLLFFCFPRSEMDRRIVQGLLDILKGPQDK